MTGSKQMGANEGEQCTSDEKRWLLDLREYVIADVPSSGIHNVSSRTIVEVEEALEISIPRDGSMSKATLRAMIERYFGNERKMTDVETLAISLKDALEESALNGPSYPASYFDGDVSNIRIDGAYDLTKAAAKVLEKIEKKESSEIGALALDAWIRDSKIATRAGILIAADRCLNELIKIIEKQKSDYSPQSHIDADGAMVEFFKEIGLDVIVQYWDQVEPKWYE